MYVTLEIFVDEMDIYNKLTISKADHWVWACLHLICCDTRTYRNPEEEGILRLQDGNLEEILASTWNILNLAAPVIT